MNYKEPSVYLEAKLVKGANGGKTIDLFRKIIGEDANAKYIERFNSLVWSTRREVVQGKLECKLVLFRGEWLAPDNNPKVPYELKGYVSSIRVADIGEIIEDLIEKLRKI